MTISGSATYHSA